ncbi:HAD hydrolase-like protein [Peribacillus muralis]|uniref:HAD hydrolase-like protein n=1 Tax=Peribacillus muralis TaxID=264697 RepID=UPI000A82523F|nr:HAD hydrolase-like protein [Peribacillus muralis]MCK1994061.1 HAD hydrolase-like protein [Peribacillus muralis]MCK2014616.1 HAD hydrolase-like protein [Peribacillus muralis]
MNTIQFAAIFDMDGTLFQTNEILGSSLERTFDILRAEGSWRGIAPLAAYQRIMGVPLSVVWETLMPEHPDHIRQQADRLFLECLNQEIKEGKGQLFPNVLETLSTFKELGISVFIASNGLEKYLEEICSYFGLHQYVTDIYSVQRSAEGSKSDLVRMLLNDHQIQNAMMIGDRKSDIEAAKKNSLTAVGCQFGFAEEQELNDADVLIADFRDLQTYVSKWLLTAGG